MYISAKNSRWPKIEGGFVAPGVVGVATLPKSPPPPNLTPPVGVVADVSARFVAPLVAPPNNPPPPSDVVGFELPKSPPPPSVVPDPVVLLDPKLVVPGALLVVPKPVEPKELKPVVPDVFPAAGVGVDAPNNEVPAVGAPAPVLLAGGLPNRLVPLVPPPEVVPDPVVPEFVPADAPNKLLLPAAEKPNGFEAGVEPCTGCPKPPKPVVAGFVPVPELLDAFWF